MDKYMEWALHNVKKEEEQVSEASKEEDYARALKEIANLYGNPYNNIEGCSIASSALQISRRVLRKHGEYNDK